MKRLIVIAGIGLGLAACARQDNTGYDTGAAPQTETGAGMTDNTTNVPNASGSETRVLSAPRPPQPGTPGTEIQAGSSDPASVTSSGETPVLRPVDPAQGKQAGENQNLEGLSPAGTGVQNGTVNTNGVGNAGTSTSQNSGGNR